MAPNDTVALHRFALFISNVLGDNIKSRVLLERAVHSPFLDLYDCPIVEDYTKYLRYKLNFETKLKIDFY